MHMNKLKHNKTVQHTLKSKSTGNKTGSCNTGLTDEYQTIVMYICHYDYPY